ncbi:MAG: hypothetical protein ACYC2H_12480 [Thermoplasmatota archaeon]
MVPMAELRDLRLHTCALNARDVETLAAQAAPHAACICDGEWIGEGPDGVRQALAKEFALNEEVFARLGVHDGEPAVLQYDAKGAQRSALRFRGEPGVGRFQELRIDHDRATVIQSGLSEPAR